MALFDQACDLLPMKKRSRRTESVSEDLAGEVLTMQERFRKLSYKSACYVGSPSAFLLSCLVILAWGLSGPYFHFSDTWQLVINTGTTIVTFLMVFLIQNTQNRDAKAIHLKLDELIRSMRGARNNFLALEDLSEEEMAQLEKEFERIRERSLANSKANGHPRENKAASN